MEIFNKKINIFIGHYGTGKTTISVNLARRWSREGKERIALADIDVNNPYFRSRDFAASFEECGVDLIIPEKEIAYAEMPFLPAGIYSAFQKEGRLIIDAGGYDTGTTVLGSLAPHLVTTDYSLWFVVNTFRPGSETAEEIVEMFLQLQAVSRLNIAGIINNSNLAAYTTEAHIIEGEKIVAAAAEMLDIFYINCADSAFALSLSGRLNAPLFPVGRLENLAWPSNGGRYEKTKKRVCTD